MTLQGTQLPALLLGLTTILACGDKGDDSGTAGDGGAMDGGSAGDGGAMDGGSAGDGGGMDGGSAGDGGAMDGGSTGDGGGVTSDADVWMVGDGTLYEFPRDAEGWYWTVYDAVEIVALDETSDYEKIDIFFYDTGKSTYSCEAGEAAITYSDESAMYYGAQASIAKSSCTIHVDVLGAADGDPITGTFTAALWNHTGAIISVTEGHFDVPRLDR